MSSLENLELEIKELIIQTLDLEDLTVEDIETEAPLFVEGLGLDSIDALELGMALSKNYGVQLSEDSEESKTHFQSIKTLASFVKQNRKK